MDVDAVFAIIGVMVVIIIYIIVRQYRMRLKIIAYKRHIQQSKNRIVELERALWYARVEVVKYKKIVKIEEKMK